MITVVLRGADKALRDLALFRKQAVPYAARNALNDSAFAVRARWQDEIKASFILRNQYTARSIRVEKTFSRDINSMQAKVGSIAEYMGRQELGGIEQARAKHKPIPTLLARGGNPTRTVRPSARLGRIKVSPAKALAVGPQKRNLIALVKAKRRGESHVVLERKGGGLGLYVVQGGKRKLKARLLYDLSRRSVRVKPEPTLQRSLKASQGTIQRIHLESVLKELKRAHVFGY